MRGILKGMTINNETDRQRAEIALYTMSYKYNALLLMSTDADAIANYKYILSMIEEGLSDIQNMAVV